MPPSFIPIFLIIISPSPPRISINLPLLVVIANANLLVDYREYRAVWTIALALFAVTGVSLGAADIDSTSSSI